MWTENYLAVCSLGVAFSTNFRFSDGSQFYGVLSFVTHSYLEL